MKKYFTFKNILASFIGSVIAGAIYWLLSTYWTRGENPLKTSLSFTLIFFLLSIFVLTPMREKEKAKRKAEQDQSAK